MRALLAAGADANADDRQGETPLHEAAKAEPANASPSPEEVARCVEGITLLLDAGSRADETDRGGSTPLHVTSSDGFPADGGRARHGRRSDRRARRRRRNRAPPRHRIDAMGKRPRAHRARGRSERPVARRSDGARSGARSATASRLRRRRRGPGEGHRRAPGRGAMTERLRPVDSARRHPECRHVARRSRRRRGSRRLPRRPAAGPQHLRAGCAPRTRRAGST